jgi:hypothetical protein
MHAFKIKTKPPAVRVRIFLILPALTFTVLLFFSCAGKTVPQGERKPVRVRAAAARATPFHDELSSFGTITYRIKNDITAQVEGDHHGAAGQGRG